MPSNHSGFNAVPGLRCSAEAGCAAATGAAADTTLSEGAAPSAGFTGFFAGPFGVFSVMSIRLLLQEKEGGLLVGDERVQISAAQTGQRDGMLGLSCSNADR